MIPSTQLKNLSINGATEQEKTTTQKKETNIVNSLSQPQKIYLKNLILASLIHHDLITFVKTVDLTKKEIKHIISYQFFLTIKKIQKIVLPELTAKEEGLKSSIEYEKALENLFEKEAEKNLATYKLHINEKGEFDKSIQEATYYGVGPENTLDPQKERETLNQIEEKTTQEVQIVTTRRLAEEYRRKLDKMLVQYSDEKKRNKTCPKELAKTLLKTTKIIKHSFRKKIPNDSKLAIKFLDISILAPVIAELKQVTFFEKLDITAIDTSADEVQTIMSDLKISYKKISIPKSFDILTQLVKEGHRSNCL